MPAAFLYVLSQLHLMSSSRTILGSALPLLALITALIATTSAISVWAVDIFSSSRSNLMGGAGKSDEILGTDGEDTIELTASDETLWHGRDFGDVIVAGNGDDIIRDSNGNEDSSGNIIYGSDGDDKILAGYFGNDIIFAGNGNDSVSCQDAPCTAYGGLGDDELQGSESPGSILFGESGNDLISAGVEGIIGFGGEGDDRILAGETPSALFGESGNDSLYGDLGSDRLYGGDGNDLIIGRAGADYMSGGDGDDVLTGDESEGDVFICGGGFDVLTDFDPAEGDKKSPDCEVF